MPIQTSSYVLWIISNYYVKMFNIVCIFSYSKPEDCYLFNMKQDCSLQYRCLIWDLLSLYTAPALLVSCRTLFSDYHLHHLSYPQIINNSQIAASSTELDSSALLSDGYKTDPVGLFSQEYTLVKQIELQAKFDPENKDIFEKHDMGSNIFLQ